MPGLMDGQVRSAAARSQAVQATIGQLVVAGQKLLSVVSTERMPSCRRSFA